MQKYLQKICMFLLKTWWSNFKLFFLQNIRLQQENTELKNKLMSLQEQAEVIQQAIRDRDEAIAK